MRVSITEQLQTYSIEILSQYRAHIEQGTFIHKICCCSFLHILNFFLVFTLKFKGIFILSY